MRRMVEKSSTIRNFMSVGVLIRSVLALGSSGSALWPYRVIGAEIEGKPMSIVGFSTTGSGSSVVLPKKRSSASRFITMMLMRRLIGLCGSLRSNSALACGKRQRVGVAFERQAVRHFGEHLADQLQQLAHVGLHARAAAVEHRPI